MTAAYVSRGWEPWSRLSPCARGTESPPEVPWVHWNGGPPEPSTPSETPTGPGKAGSSPTRAPAHPQRKELISRPAGPERDPPMATQRGRSDHTRVCRGLPGPSVPRAREAGLPTAEESPRGEQGSCGSRGHPGPAGAADTRRGEAAPGPALLPARLCPRGRCQPTEAAALSLPFCWGPSALGNGTGFQAERPPRAPAAGE